MSNQEGYPGGIDVQIEALRAALKVPGEPLGSEVQLLRERKLANLLAIRAKALNAIEQPA